MENTIRHRIIGGVFGLEVDLEGAQDPQFLRKGDILFVNARSALYCLVQRLTPKHIWMPSYLCSSMLDAIRGTNTSIRLYEVDYDLRSPSLKWIAEISRGDIVVIVDYFGFPADPEIAFKARKKGAWVLEDACQALLTEVPRSIIDFVIFSPRKFLGIPDGGILWIQTAKGQVSSISNLLLEPAPQEWWFTAFCSSFLRREFDLKGVAHNWFNLFKTSEAHCPIGLYAMSELSQTLLRQGFNYERIARQRQNNYLALLERLADIALFPNLSTGIIPLGFPVRVPNRDRIQQALFNHKIYPPVHWPLNRHVPEHFRDSHRLASHLMTLPCDQRYDIEGMQHMAAVVTKEMRK
ncbi:MAG: DegT/DnrJ/EryC1/StrS family aminotransferase [bacterium]